MSDEPTERDVEALAAKACVAVGLSPRWAEQLAPVLAVDLAERIAEARREGAAEVTARVGALADAWDDPDPERGDPDKADALRAALRGDA